MKTIKLDKNSSHYWLVSKFRVMDRHELVHTDICAYGRAVVGGLFVTLILLAIYTFVVFILTDIILGISFSLIYGTWMMNPQGEAGLLLLAIATVVVSGVLATILFKHWRNGREDSEPGFISSYYRSIKEKYCVKVKFKE